MLFAAAVSDWRKRSSRAVQRPSGLGLSPVVDVPRPFLRVFQNGAVSSPSASAHRRSSVALARTRFRRTRLPVSDLSQFTALHRTWSAVPVIVSSLHLIRHGCTRLSAPSVGSSSFAHPSPSSHRTLPSFLTQAMLGDPLPYGSVGWRRFPSYSPNILGQRATPLLRQTTAPHSEMIH